MILKKYVPVDAGAANCTSCGGVGFYLTEKVVGAQYGVLSLCHCISQNCPCGGKPPYRVYSSVGNKMEPCVCYDARLLLGEYERLFKKASIPPKYQFRTLDSLDLAKTIAVEFFIAHTWATDFVQHWEGKQGPQSHGLYLWGRPGTGKTLLACAILNELIFKHRVACKYAKINRDFLNALRESYQKGSEYHGMESAIETEFAEIDLLVIDDFGVQKESDWSNSKLYDLIDARYEQGRLTIFTSNASPAEWKDKAEGRIYSRLQEMTRAIELANVADYRSKLADGSLVQSE